MNSDKAAAVRDSINGCPDVVDPDDTSEYSQEVEKTEFGKDVTYAGEFLKPDPSKFRPAYIEQSGTVSDGDGSERPVYVVVLDTLWHDPTDVRSLSPEMVYEVAKHDCRVRFYPPGHRLGGSIWIVDHFTEDLSSTDGDRCSECGSTYFKMRDGSPECARCGHTEATEPEQTTLVTDGGVETAEPAIPPAVEHLAGRPIYALVCHDCLLEAYHADLRTIAGEHRAHLRAHPDHELSYTTVSGEGDDA